tara:strand:+ start:214 stop:387 length:174 start_codon:yes stop_codon:yes gene_type:complete
MVRPGDIGLALLLLILIKYARERSIELSPAVEYEDVIEDSADVTRWKVPRTDIVALK